MAGTENQTNNNNNNNNNSSLSVSTVTDFVNSGIYKFPNPSSSTSNTTEYYFLNPVKILNLQNNYTKTHFKISPSTYYSRFFLQQQQQSPNLSTTTTNTKRKRKRPNNQNSSYTLNEKELISNQRHLEIRDILVKAHEGLLGNNELLEVIKELNCEENGWERCVSVNDEGNDDGGDCEEVSFVELGKVWQAPFYEIDIDFSQVKKHDQENGASAITQHDDHRLLPIFNNLVSNDAKDGVLAAFLNRQYMLPKESSFYMNFLHQISPLLNPCPKSDLGQIQNLIPGDSDFGFNFILADPPWENRSAYQKSKYPTLPNRYFLSIPIRQLTHTAGALVALWVTNREKLRTFVESELFPAWGVKYVATLYWLKVKADGSLICDLDLFHHRPYECLLLGYSGRGEHDAELLSMAKSLKDKVMITIPGDYSRKPPVADLLLEHVPGPKPARCLELFAREMMAGWTSWGNEPLHFQELKYFSRKLS